MKHLFVFLPVLLLSVSAFAQVDVDKAINLSGAADGDRAVKNLAPPVLGTDAANKDYVDAQSGSSGHSIGELFGGGAIFEVHKDENGDEHGLVVSLINNGTDVWSDVSSSEIGGLSAWDGAMNSTAILAQPGHSSSAAKTCDDYVAGGNNDWFLPSISQLNQLWVHLYPISLTLINTGGAAVMAPEVYWSSTEVNSSNAQVFFFRLGGSYTYSKNDALKTRCIRAF